MVMLDSRICNCIRVPVIDANGGINAADTAAIGDLTDNRVVIAGTGGELEDDANLTFDGSTCFWCNNGTAAISGDETVTIGKISIGSVITALRMAMLNITGITTYQW